MSLEGMRRVEQKIAAELVGGKYPRLRFEGGSGTWQLGVCGIWQSGVCGAWYVHDWIGWR
jgi:hypothetical protein